MDFQRFVSFEGWSHAYIRISFFWFHTGEKMLSGPFVYRKQTKPVIVEKDMLL
jgi:hypothetical protein